MLENTSPPLTRTWRRWTGKILWRTILFEWRRTSKTVVKNYNAYVFDPTSPLTIYPPTAEAYYTSAAPPAYPDRLQSIYVYMHDLICADQGDAAQQQMF